MNQVQSKLHRLRQKGTSALNSAVWLLVPRLPVILALLFAALSPSVQAQYKSPAATPSPSQDEQEIDPGDVISVNTTEVLLPVTVRNRSGQLVTDLTRKDFRIFEEGAEQTLSDLSLRQVPV